MCLSRADTDKMFGIVGIPIASLATYVVGLGVRFTVFHTMKREEIIPSNIL
ncbi:hypothetical protein ACS0TY_022522 [Phlomoides rotata]